jgi:hypothetical protein
MDRTLDESRQLDMLFEHLMASRLNDSNPGTTNELDSTIPPLPPQQESTFAELVPRSGIPPFDSDEFCMEAVSLWKGSLLTTKSDCNTLTGCFFVVRCSRSKLVAGSV